MGFLEDKKTAAALILRKMRGSESYDDMKSSNEELRHVPVKDGAEVMLEDPCGMACEEMMRAVRVGDASMFKRALDAYMDLREYSQEDDD